MKLKKGYPIIITAVIALLVGSAFVAILLRPQPLDIGSVDLNTVSDGEYIGCYADKRHRAKGNRKRTPKITDRKQV